MRRFSIILALPLVALLSCGTDNVASCEDWIASMDCGDVDWSTYVDCSVYADLECDVSEYFECLTDNTTCDEKLGIPDMTGWAACSTKATCD